MKNRTFFSILTIVLGAHSAFADARATVVLIPGAGSSGTEIYVPELPKIVPHHYFGAYQESLAKQGVPNLVCPKTPDNDSRSLEQREEDCVQVLLAAHGENPESKFILVGHSMGGLIARELAQDPRVSDLVKSVVTISTPHRGTPFADAVLEHEEKNDKKAFDIIGWVAEIAGFSNASTRYLPELRTNHSASPAEVFTAQNMPDNPKIAYFSYSSAFNNDPLNMLEIPHTLLKQEIHSRGLDQTRFGADNDGVVPEYSQVYGTYLGHLEANHWEAACVDPVKGNQGCHRTLAIVIPFLASQASKN